METLLLFIIRIGEKTPNDFFDIPGWWWVGGLVGWMMWNVLLWGFAHDEADSDNKSFNWKKYKRTHIDDAVVTLLVGVPLTVWKNVWLWNFLFNTVIFKMTGSTTEYDTIGLILSGPIVQGLYWGVKWLKNARKKLASK